jgi:hypothetical protein
MTHVVELIEPLCKNGTLSIVEEHPDTAIKEIAIVALASSPSCGLLMLIEKIITNGVRNDATAHLVQNLINRVHKQSIAITPSTDDNPESFVSLIVDTAEKTTIQRYEHISPLYNSAKVLLDSLKLYRLNKLNLSNLEQHWKDFAAILLNERLKSLVGRQKASSQ